MAASKLVLAVAGAAAAAGVTVAVVAAGGSGGGKSNSAVTTTSTALGAATDASTSAARLLADPSCQQEPDVKSVDGNTAFNLTFVNNTAEPVQSLWINYQGKRVFYRQIPAGSAYVQPTWITHPWVVARLDGTCLTMLVVDGHRSTVTVPAGSTGPVTPRAVVDAGTALGNAAVNIQADDTLHFSPPSVDVHRNDIVEWDNSGTIGHNVTFDAPAVAPFNDLHLDAGGHWQVRFTTAGTFTYSCTIHQGMTGTVTVR